MDSQRSTKRKMVESILKGFVEENIERTEINEDYLKRPKGHWDEYENVKKELEKIINKLGHFPTQKELSELGFSGVSAAAQKHGGLISVRQQMGYEITQRRHGFWKDFTNVRTELNEIIGKLGHFPTQTELSEHGYGYLASAMDYHGGLNAVCQRMHYKPLTVPKGHWMKWDNVEKVLKKMIAGLGHFPNYEDFKRSKYSSIPAAIKDFHGGMDKARKHLGYEYTGTRPGHWKDFRNIKDTLEGLERKLGHFPSVREISENGFKSLPSSMHKYHGGFHSVAKKLGKETKLKPRGYWTKKKVLELCQELVDERGDFPTQEEIEELNGKYKGLISGVSKYGINTIKLELNLEFDKKPKGYWTRKRILEEARKIVEEKGYLPGQKELGEMGRGDLVGAIGQKYSFNAIRKKLGLEINKVEDGFWTEERILKECKKIVKKEGDLPTKDGLAELKLSALAGQIEKNGGYPHFRELLGLSLRKRQNRFWTKERTLDEANQLYEKFGYLPSYEQMYKEKLTTLPTAIIEHYKSKANIVEILDRMHNKDNSREINLRKTDFVEIEIRGIMKKHRLEGFPGRTTLVKLGYQEIVSAINRYHGGFNSFREEIGEKVVKPNDTWTNPDYVLKVVKRIMKKHGWKVLPSEKVLREKGYNMIPVGIRQSFGKMSKFRKKLGEKPQRLDNGTWKDLEYTLSEAQKAAEKIGYSSLPPQKVLCSNGYFGLSAAIANYHGGFPAFRERLREYMHQPTQREQTEGLLEGYIHD